MNDFLFEILMLCEVLSRAGRSPRGWGRGGGRGGGPPQRLVLILDAGVASLLQRQAQFLATLPS